MPGKWPMVLLGGGRRSELRERWEREEEGDEPPEDVPDILALAAGL